MTFDARVTFYLEHRDQLQEWFNLRPDVAAAMDVWLTMLDGDLRKLADELGADVRMVAETNDEEPWPGFYLHRTSWPHIRGEGSVFIGLQWARGRTLLGDSTTPYTGLRCRSRTPIGDAIRADAEFQKARKQWKAITTPWWAAYSYVRVADNEPFPEQADAYRARLVETVRRAWTDFAPLVDRALVMAAARSQGS